MKNFCQIRLPLIRSFLNSAVCSCAEELDLEWFIWQVTGLALRFFAWWLNLWLFREFAWWRQTFAWRFGGFWCLKWTETNVWLDYCWFCIILYHLGFEVCYFWEYMSAKGLWLNLASSWSSWVVFGIEIAYVGWIEALWKPLGKGKNLKSSGTAVLILQFQFRIEEISILENFNSELKNFY